MKYGNQTGLVALIAAATLAISNPAMADPVKSPTRNESSVFRLLRGGA